MKNVCFLALKNYVNFEFSIHLTNNQIIDILNTVNPLPKDWAFGTAFFEAGSVLRWYRDRNPQIKFWKLFCYTSKFSVQISFIDPNGSCSKPATWRTELLRQSFLDWPSLYLYRTFKSMHTGRQFFIMWSHNPPNTFLLIYSDVCTERSYFFYWRKELG